MMYVVITVFVGLGLLFLVAGIAAARWPASKQQIGEDGP